MTQLTETTSNYNTDRNDCQKQPFDTTFYIATLNAEWLRLDSLTFWRRLQLTTENWLPTATTANLDNHQPRQPPRDTPMRSIIF